MKNTKEESFDEIAYLYEMTHRNTKKARKYAGNKRYLKHLKDIYSIDAPVELKLNNGKEYYLPYFSPAKKHYRKSDNKRFRKINLFGLNNGSSYKRVAAEIKRKDMLRYLEDALCPVEI